MKIATTHDGKLPYIQLYVADLLRDCEHLSLEAFGAWVKILCRMHTANPRGIVRVNPEQLARMLGTTPVKGGVILEELKNPDNPTGAPVLDHKVMQGGVIELRSRRMVRDDEMMQRNRRNGALGGNPKLLVNTELNDKVVNRGVNRGVGKSDKAKSQSQSHITREVSLEPSSGQPSASPAKEVKNDAVDISVPPSETEAAKPRKGHRILDDHQAAVRKQFIDWWTMEAWPRAVGGGEEYPFGAEASRNGQAVSKLLVAVKYDLDQAKAVARAFLTTPDIYVAKQNRPLFLLGQHLTTWIASSRSPRSTAATRRTNEQQQREYTEPAHTARVI